MQMLWIFLKVGVDTGVSYASINWAAEESQLEFVIAIIYVLITRLHAYIINQNEQLSGKVSAVPHVCITSHKTWDYPLKAPYMLFPFVVIKENKTSDLKLFYFYPIKMWYCDRNYEYKFNCDALANLYLDMWFVVFFKENCIKTE